jgi:hypothetical protein
VNCSPGSVQAERYLEQIAERLRGPAAVRQGIIAELRDGVLAAAEAGRRAGLGGEAAMRLALREFGDAALVADSFVPELAVARARRVVVMLFATAPVVVLLWIAAARSRGPGGGERLFDGAPDHIAAALVALAAIGCGAWTIATTGRATRRLRVPPGSPLLGATATAGVIAMGDLALLCLLASRLAGFAGALHWLALGAAVLASGARLVLSTRAGWSCLAMRATTHRHPT